MLLPKNWVSDESESCQPFLCQKTTTGRNQFKYSVVTDDGLRYDVRKSWKWRIPKCIVQKTSLGEQ